MCLRYCSFLNALQLEAFPYRRFCSTRNFLRNSKTQTRTNIQCPPRWQEIAHTEKRHRGLYSPFFSFFFSQKRTTNPWNYKSAIGWMRFDEGLPHKAAARAYWSSDELFVIRSSKKWARDNSRLPRWEPTYCIALGRGTNRGLLLQRKKNNNPTWCIFWLSLSFLFVFFVPRWTGA